MGLKITLNRIIEKLKLLSKSKLFWAFILNFIFFLYAFIFGQLTFETNDDREICNILSNVYGTGQREYIVFINIIIGYCLRFFYILIPSINWYVIISLLLNFFSLVLITYCIYKKTDLYLGSLINVAILIIFYQESYVSFQFTKNAFLYLTAGLLVIVSAYQDWKQQKVFLAIGSIFMIVGSLFRFQCFEGIAPFIVLICLAEFFVIGKRKWSSFVPLFTTLIVTIIVILGCRGLQLYKYENNPKWNYYRTYNEKRAELTDYNTFPYEEYEDELKGAGISLEDYDLLLKWTYADPEVYSLETINKLVEIKNSHLTNKSFFNITSFVEFISDVVDNCQEYIYLYVIAVLGFLVIILDIRKTYISAIFLGGIFAEWYIYAWLERIVFRTLYGSILIGSIFALYYILSTSDTNLYYEFRQNVAHKLQRNMFLLSLFILILCGIPQSITMLSNKVYYEENTEYDDLLKEITQNKDSIYLIDRPTLTNIENGYSPYKVVPKGSYENVCILGGWIYPTPQNNTALESFSIKNPMKALATKKSNIYLVDGVSPELKKEYLSHHYEENINLKIEKESQSYTIYTFDNGSEE